VLLATEIDPSEQVGAGLKVVEMLQVRATVEGLRPPKGLIVIMDCPDAPAATESDVGEDDRLKSGTAAATTKLTTLEVLTLKLPSPL